MCTYGGGLGPKLKPLVEYNEPGKIMIIETPQSKSTQVSSCWGAIESARAKALGAEGVIVSGNVRQVDQLQDVGLPVSHLFSTSLCTLSAIILQVGLIRTARYSPEASPRWGPGSTCASAVPTT